MPRPPQQAHRRQRPVRGRSELLNLLRNEAKVIA